MEEDENKGDENNRSNNIATQKQQTARNRKYPKNEKEIKRERRKEQESIKFETNAKD